jgi:hypothetical protein
LSGLHKQVLIQALWHGLLCRTSDGHHSSEHSNCRERQKVTQVTFVVGRRKGGQTGASSGITSRLVLPA